MNTSFAAAFAVTIAYGILRRMNNFPGLQSGSRILFIVSATFAAMLIVFLLTRLNYSRFLFASSYLLSVFWFGGYHLISKKFEKLKLALVPGGQIDELTRLGGVECSYLQDPDDSILEYSSVIADLRSDLPDEWERFLADCTLAGKPVYHFKQVFESLTGRVQIEHLSENNLGALLPGIGSLKIKHMLDWVVALLLFPFFILLCAVIAPVIKLTSKGPVFFRQVRTGYRGRCFEVWKFRTMVHRGAQPGPKGQQEPEREGFMTKHDDMRITSIGRVLRRYRIDELPQILNILSGDMSWIGPRPEALSLSQWYEAELPFYRYRHVVRPGISGWAQINQGHVADPKEVHVKLQYDFFYVKYLSPWLDFLIALRTIRIILSGFGSK
uniref:sugar transferase n=1 Tax=Pararhizobium sp. IMCC3301 TaxID=3067904 RepID=UPI00274031E5|nr:sugar transferase [Pararhizobium sp. IMCC3301]